VTAQAGACLMDLETRARLSLGSSNDAIYRMVARAMAAHSAGGCLVDVGCGGGGLWREVHTRFTRYCGLDAVRYDALPGECEFSLVDLDGDRWPLQGSGDAVVAIETIEHLENPWAFIRRLASLAKPGALVVVTTPNQLSALSVLTLVVKQRFSAFQDAHFPAHRTALLECDLVRAVGAAGLDLVEVAYSRRGRLPLMPWHCPAFLSAVFPRALSDNMMIVARKPRD